MASLKSPKDDAIRPIPPRLLIGRSAACGLQLSSRHVSSEHAAIKWTGGHWEVRDLGSRNGTFVDGTRIDTGQSVRIVEGTRIAFAETATVWTVVDDAPPSIMAIHRETGHVHDGHRDLLLLPTAENPEVSNLRRREWSVVDGFRRSRCCARQRSRRDRHDGRDVYGAVARPFPK